MALEYYALLGLAPERYTREVIASHYFARRTRLLATLHDPRYYAQGRRRLEEMHLAYAVLSDPRLQREYLRTDGYAGRPVEHLRALIAASLEDGLMRHSRRQAVLAAARTLGVNDFQAQLLIAQVQFGEEEPDRAREVVRPGRVVRGRRIGTRVLGAGALAAATFLFLARWLAA